MSEKTKKIIGTVVNVLIWIFVVFSVLVTVLTFAAQGNKEENHGIPVIFGKGLVTIQTESMTGTFNKGDLVIMTKLDENEKRNLEVGTVITYLAPIDINGDGKINDINTHRIYSHKEGSLTYVTQGDNNTVPDNYDVDADEIIGVCKGARIPGLGAVLSFLRTPLGFFLCIVLPLILFFLYEVYVFVSVLISERSKKTAGVTSETEEEIKRRAIEEYKRELELKAAEEAKRAEEEKKNAPATDTDDTSDGSVGT